MRKRYGCPTQVERLRREGEAARQARDREVLLAKSREVKETKTDNPREMLVHPTLKDRAAWKLEVFERYIGRKPWPTT